MENVIHLSEFADWTPEMSEAVRGNPLADHPIETLSVTFGSKEYKFIRKALLLDETQRPEGT